MPDIALWPNCDHKCTMCSNEADYKYSTSDYTFDKLKNRIDNFLGGDEKQFRRFPDLKDDWTITGGEPTLNPDYFKVLSYLREKCPNSKIVQLTHGDNFANETFTKKISTIENYHIVFPIHGYNKFTHEAIVRTDGSWEKLIRGMFNVLKYKKFNNQTLEIRIIIQGQNYKHLDKMYAFLYKYFGNKIDSIVTVMMEYEGQAVDNKKLTAVNYKDVLSINTDVFLDYGLKFGESKFRLYHFPLCTLDNKGLWKYMWRTLPDVEIQYLDKCNECELKKYCMGIHENYCGEIGEHEIIPFSKKSISNIKIIDEDNNFRFKPIQRVENINKNIGKKTVIFTGYACDNFCRFCIDLNKRDVNHGTKNIIKDILLAKQDGTEILEIIGGEVTIRKDFFQIMSFIKSMKFRHVYMVTNGNKLANMDFARKLYNMNVLNSIVFSIHGANSELHDKLVRTPGSFDKLLQGITNFQELGFDLKKIGTNTAIEKGNYHDLLNIGKLIKEINCLGTSEFIFADPNVGGVHDNFEELMPHISEASTYMRKLLLWGNNNNMIYRVRYVPLCHFVDFLDNNISELNELKIYSNVSHIAPDFNNSNVSLGRKITGRIKPDKCKGCMLYNKCEGIWKEYYDKLGGKELMPIKN